jgi:hypothetical protein
MSPPTPPTTICPRLTLLQKVRGNLKKKGTVLTLQRHNAENSKQIFPEKELRGYNPNSYIHVSVSDLYILLISLPILMQVNEKTERGKI